MIADRSARKQNVLKRLVVQATRLDFVPPIFPSSFHSYLLSCWPRLLSLSLRFTLFGLFLNPFSRFARLIRRNGLQTQRWPSGPFSLPLARPPRWCRRRDGYPILGLLQRIGILEQVLAAALLEDWSEPCRTSDSMLTFCVSSCLICCVVDRFYR